MNAMNPSFLDVHCRDSSSTYSSLLTVLAQQPRILVHLGFEPRSQLSQDLQNLSLQDR